MSLKESDRHNLLHFLEDEKYEEVMAVLGSFPYVTMDIKSQGEWEVSCCFPFDRLPLVYLAQDSQNTSFNNITFN